MALSHPSDVDRRAPQIPGALRAGDDDREPAVGYQAAIEQMKRLDHPARTAVVVEAQWHGVELRGRIAVGPLARGDGDGAEVVVTGAVEVHVAPGDHGVHRVDAELAVRRLQPASEPIRGCRTAAGGPLLRGGRRFEGCV